MNITLTTSVPRSTLLPGGASAWLVEFAVAATGPGSPSDNGFFIYRGFPPAQARGSVCEAVVNLHSLLELPYGAPVDIAVQPLYRLNRGLFCCLSLIEATELKQRVSEDLNALVSDWNAREDMVVESEDTLTGETAAGIPGTSPSNYARTEFNADRSALYVYDINGTLVAEIPIVLPS